MSIALLVIDLQKDFFDTEYSDLTRAERTKQDLASCLNQLLDTARQSGILVVFIKTSLLPDRSNWNLRMKDINSSVCIRGTPGEALISEIRTGQYDLFITKERYSAFFRTRLDEILQARAVNSLIICGINTHACVRTTAIDAFMRDYRVFIPIECVASYDQDQHSSTLNYFSKRIAKVLKSKEMITRIRGNNYDFKFTE